MLEKSIVDKQIILKSIDIDVVCAGEVYWKIYVESNQDFYGNFSLVAMTEEDGLDRLSQKLVNNYQSLLHNIPEKQRFQTSCLF